MEQPQVAMEGQDRPEALLQRYAAGDATAFTTLVELYEGPLFAFLARFIGDAHLAEDVFQQVFVKVAVKAAAYDGRASFTTWLYRIARNTAIDELRKQRASYLTMDPDAVECYTAADTATPLEAMAQNELGEMIRHGLSLLPEPQRETFLLREEADLSFEEIGVVLNCGKETAKSRFRLAVQKLRESLEPYIGSRQD